MGEGLLESTTPDPRRLRLFGAVLLLATIVAYLPAINAGFVWDDDLLVTANPQMYGGHGLAEIWLGRNSCDYTPLTLSTFWIEQRLWRHNPVGYHIVNILFHGIATVLLWRTLLALRIPGAWLAALLFAIHPVNVASVAWIAERKNTLSAALFFGSLFLFIEACKRSDAKPSNGSSVGSGREDRSPAANTLLVWAAILFLLAGLSKGAVVGLPLVLVGCIIWLNGKVTRRDILRLIPFAGIALLIALATIYFQAAATDYRFESSRLVFRLARAGTVPWFYLREILLPVGLSPFSPMWQPDLHSLVTYLPPLLLVALTALFVWKWRTWGRPLLLAFGYYFWMLLPVLGFIWMTFQQQTPCADWWQYLAAPGMFAAIAVGFILLVRGSNRTRNVCVYASLGTIIFLLTLQTWRRCAIYESMETYCRAVLAENPHAWALQNNLGILLKEQGELDRATACYRAALRDNPRYLQAHNNLGNVLQAQGKAPEAETEFRTALELEPRNAEVLANLSHALFAQGRVRDALATNAQAIKLDPLNPERYIQFAIKLSANHQFDQAVVCFKLALVLRPGDPGIELELARSLIAAGRPDDAAAVCDSAVRSAVKSGNTHMLRTFAMLRDQCHSAAQ